MLSKTEVVNWLWENCRDKDGDLRLDGLDLTIFDDVYFRGNKIRNDLDLSHQEVGGSLFQDHQKVKRNFINHKLAEDEYWKDYITHVIRKKKTKEITLGELESLGYKLKEEK